MICIVKSLLRTALKDAVNFCERPFNVNSNFTPTFVTMHAITAILTLSQYVDTHEQSSSSFASEDQSNSGFNHRELSDDENHIFRMSHEYVFDRY